MPAPPTWAFKPVTAWLYLAGAVLLALTPAAILCLILNIFAAIFTYQDRSTHELPAFAWTASVVLFGPLAYLFFVYRRPQPAVVYSPEAALTQQARLARGLPPKAPGAIPAGWYDDPTKEARIRYWDGTRWTTHTED
jgi:hypothetical protein